MRSKKQFCFIACLFATAIANAESRMPGFESYQPSKVDLSKLVQCGYASQEMFNLGFVVVNTPAEEKKLKWRKISKPGSYITIYETGQTISAFGIQSRKIAFEGMRALAVLDSATAPDLAKQLSLSKNDNAVHGTQFFRVHGMEAAPRPGDPKKAQAIIVSTKPDQPNMTFVGCDYDHQQ